jgi:hypothetical protein
VTFDKQFLNSLSESNVVIQAGIGELIVGSYLRLIEDCELVSYNQRSKDAGRQVEVDVLGVESADGQQTVYACEVVTHLHGMLYSGSPDTDEWTAYGGESYQYTLERLWDKFVEDHTLLLDVFDDADEYVLQLWSPVVPEGKLTEGLTKLRERFGRERGPDIELVTNETYTRRIDRLRRRAGETKQSYDEPAFRFLQFLEHLREN